MDLVSRLPLHRLPPPHPPMAQAVCPIHEIVYPVVELVICDASLHVRTMSARMKLEGLPLQEFG